MFPGAEENTSKRQFRRVDFRGIVSFEFPETAQEIGCVSEDLSEKGLRVNVENFVKPGTPIRIKFRFTPGSRPLVFEGRVAWANKAAVSDRYRLGIEFTGSEDGQKDVRQYVDSQKK